MIQNSLAPNETMQLHEILMLKSLLLTKAVTISPIVSDDELKSIIKTNITLTQQHINEIKGFMEQTVTVGVPENPII